jgi:Erv1 / Alr family
MQFPPSVWGPFFWHTIHIVALGYSKTPTYTDKKCAKEFYESLAYLLPCSICREHYRDHLTKYPITTFLDSRTDLIKWTIMIHNHVNKMLGKVEWTLQEVLTYYEKVGARNRSPVWTKEDMNEVDYRSFIKGFLTGSVILCTVGGVAYMINRM